MPNYSINFIAEVTGLSVEFLSKCPLSEVIELGNLAAKKVNSEVKLRQQISMIKIRNQEAK